MNRKLSATEKADAYDALILRIHKRSPGTEAILQTFGGIPTPPRNTSLVNRFFAAHDAMINELKANDQLYDPPESIG